MLQDWFFSVSALGQKVVLDNIPPQNDILMWDSLLKFSISDSGKIIVPALIGAVVAIITILIKDIILHEIRESRKEKKELIHTKLSKLYGPLYTVVVSATSTLSTYFSDDENYRLFVGHQHLLSEELQKLIDECLSTGKGNFRNPICTPDEMKKIINITEKFKIQLEKEMKILRKNYT